MSLRDELNELRDRLDRIVADLASQSQRPSDPIDARDDIMGRVIGRVPSSGSDCSSCDDPGDCDVEVWDVEFINLTKDKDNCAISEVTAVQRNGSYTVEAIAPPSFGLSENSIVELRLDRSGDWFISQKYGVCGAGGGSTDCNSGFCGPDQVATDVVDSVSCVNGAIVVCTKTLCLPAGSKVSTIDCGGGSAGSGLPGEGEVSTSCCPDGLPETLNGTLSFTQCSCVTTQEVTLTWNGSRWVGSAAMGTCSGTVSVELYCNDSDSTFNAYIYVSSCTTGTTITLATGSCSPLSLTTSQSQTMTGCCSAQPSNVPVVSMTVSE